MYGFERLYEAANGIIKAVSPLEDTRDFFVVLGFVLDVWQAEKGLAVDEVNGYLVELIEARTAVNSALGGYDADIAHQLFSGE